MSAELERLNTLEPDRATTELLRCCGSRRWAESMVEKRPYVSADALYAAGEEVADALGADDWLEAFAAHPRIGERPVPGASARDTTAWSSREQAGVGTSTDDVRARLAMLNDAYRDRFGYIFIVCATGLSGLEMLRQLRERLDHEPDEEIEIAVGQQRRITRLRLGKLIGDPAT